MTVTSEGLPLNSKFKIRREERVSRFHTQRPLVVLFAMRINNLTVIYLQLCYFKKSFAACGLI